MPKEKVKFITIAVDFDGTIIQSGQYPKANKEIPNAVYCLKRLKTSPKIKLILLSCRDKFSDIEAYENMIKWCNENDLVFDAINDNIDEYKNKNFKCRKIFANIYIDDLSMFIFNNSTSAIGRNKIMEENWRILRNAISTDSGLNFWIESMLNKI